MKCIMVTSPLFMSRMRSSSLPSKTVVVNCPFPKPEMLGSKKKIVHQYSGRVAWAPNAGRPWRAREVYSASCFGLSTLGTGEMCAVFQMRGNYELEIYALMMCARGPVRKSPTCLTYLTGIWLTPVEQSNLNRIISLRTSSVDTVRSWRG